MPISRATHPYAREARFLSRFDPGVALNHGGRQRSKQLAELLSTCSVPTVPIPTPRLGSYLRALVRTPVRWLRSLPTLLHAISAGMTLVGAIAAHATRLALHDVPEVLQRHRVYLETGLDWTMLASLSLRELDVPHVILPQNVEWLVPGQGSGPFRSMRHAKAFELDMYLKAEEVWTISELDAATLRSAGVREVRCLPYAPPAEIDARWRAIAARRGGTSKAGYLILGSAGNPPARLGMERLLEALQRSHSGDTFRLVGRGSEIFRGRAPSNVDVLGSVPDSVLDDLLAHTCAVIIAHAPTSGFLTRIVDLNHAEVPILWFGEYPQIDGFEAYGHAKLADVTNLGDPPAVRATFAAPRLRCVEGGRIEPDVVAWGAPSG